MSVQHKPARQVHLVGAAFALAVVVVYVDGALGHGRALCDLFNGASQQVQHESAVVKGVCLAPGHVLRQHEPR